MVSRETSGPPAPDSARGVLAEQGLLTMQRYVELLATEGVVRGLIGPREAPRLWERHVLNCVALSEAIAPGQTVADVGSGAGLPGLVLAIARPDLHLTLIEPLLRRTVFLEECVVALGLDNVEVLRGRADVLHGSRAFDVVTSRAVAPLPRLLAWSMPLVSATGSVLALKGAHAHQEVDEAADELRRLGCAPAEVLALGGTALPEPAHAVRVAWADPSSVGWPVGPSSGSRAGTQSPSSRKRRNRRG